MKIVTNGKGLYAIRKGFWPFYKYLEMGSFNIWNDKDSLFFSKCWAGKNRVESFFGILNPKVCVTIIEDKLTDEK